MKIITLGPEGTFSHAAAKQLSGDHDIYFAKTIAKVFAKIREESFDRAVLPLENSVSGTVSFTIDGLLNMSYPIISEIVLPIEHHLASFVAKDSIKILYAHPHSYAQCERYVETLGDIEVILTASNADSAIKLLENKGNAGAIVPKIAIERYQLLLLEEKIQDEKGNQTRFIVLGSEKAKPTGHDRTSIVIFPPNNKPRVLSTILEPFAARDINLSKIESRPSKKKLGEYLFYLDFHGHQEDKIVQEALKALQEVAEFTLLGSYPRAY